MSMKISPLSDRVLVKQLDGPQQTAGGIFIPDSASKKGTKWGTVEEVGPGKFLENGSLRPMTVKKGSKVLFGEYSGTKVKIDEVDFLVMHEDDVIAIAQ